MSEIQQLFKYAEIDKEQVINSLLESIGSLEYQLHVAREQVKTNGQVAIDVINREREQHNEEIQKHMTQHAKHLEHLELINEICAQNNLVVKCCKCERMYELPCDISEFDPEYSYCGKGGPSPCTP